MKAAEAYEKAIENQMKSLRERIDSCVKEGGTTIIVMDYFLGDNKEKLEKDGYEIGTPYALPGMYLRWKND